MKHRLSKTFGHQSVAVNKREKLIRSVFQRVAGRYDLMNDLMSMGIHRFWKWRFTREINRIRVATGIDLAGGTGDIASKILGHCEQTIIADPSLAMIQVAQKRLREKCTYIAASAENLPFPDNYSDLLTISFGIRNTTDIVQALNEITRVLKPGGRFYCLEFSQPAAWLRPFYDSWSRLVIPRLGQLVAGHPDAYHYLIESIREFPAQQEMAQLIANSGLENVSYTNLSFGIACIHRATKSTGKTSRP
jgi:demethylmenaquinone methyltransferase / 2-methoxy-6-polyprenyl-1,4-benzoquinol methylase